jgi:hypothetical protein
MLSASSYKTPMHLRLAETLLLAVLVLFSAVPARAQLSIDTKTGQDLQITISSAELNVEVRVHNSDDEGRQIAIGNRLYKSGEQTSVALTSTSIGKPANDVVAKGADARYALTATLAEPGSFTGTVDVLSADGKQIIRSIRLNVPRQGQPVPTGLMVTPAALTVTWPLSLVSPSETLILLRNDGARPVNIGTPQLLSFGSGSGTADSKGADSSGIRLDDSACAKPLLDPGASCAIKVMLKNPLWPGSYSLAVGVGGAAGGWSQQTLAISAGLSIIVAFIVAALGLYVGVALDEWRKRGRPLVESLIKLQTLAENLGKPPLGPQPKPELKVATELLKQDVARCRDGINDTPPDATMLASLQTRYDRLVQACLLLDTLETIDEDGRQLIGPRIETLLALLTDPQPSDQKAANLAAASRAVADDLRSLQQTRQLRGRARAALAALGRLGDPQPADADFAAKLEAAARPIREADAALRKPLPSGLADADLADTLAKRTGNLTNAMAEAGEAAVQLTVRAKALLKAKIATFPEPPRAEFQNRLDALASDGDWVSSLAALAGLWSAAFAASPALPEALESADSPPAPEGLAIQDVRIDVIGSFSGLTAEQMRARRADYEWWWNAAVIALFALGLSVASITPTWGSLGDISKLFLSGVGARLALAALTKT